MHTAALDAGRIEFTNVMRELKEVPVAWYPPHLRDAHPTVYKPQTFPAAPNVYSNPQGSRPVDDRPPSHYRTENRDTVTSHAENVSMLGADRQLQGIPLQNGPAPSRAPPSTQAYMAPHPPSTAKAAAAEQLRYMTPHCQFSPDDACPLHSPMGAMERIPHLLAQLRVDIDAAFDSLGPPPPPAPPSQGSMREGRCETVAGRYSRSSEHAPCVSDDGLATLTARYPGRRTREHQEKVLNGMIFDVAIALEDLSCDVARRYRDAVQVRRGGVRLWVE
jgi:hypothetical protein